MTPRPEATRPAPSRGSGPKGTKGPRPGRRATGCATRARVGPRFDPRRDPATMAPGARIGELGAILASGYRRRRLNRQNGLDESAEPEAPCDPAVDGDGADPAQEAP